MRVAESACGKKIVRAPAAPNLEGLNLEERIEVLRRTNTKLNKPRAKRRPPIGGKWAKEEDEMLKKIVETHGAKNWKKIAEILGTTRTDVQCLHRWNKVLKVRPATLREQFFLAGVSHRVTLFVSWRCLVAFTKISSLACTRVHGRKRRTVW